MHVLTNTQHIGPSPTQQAGNRQAKHGWFPLLVTSKQGNLDIVEFLLRHNVRVYVFDDHINAVLHLAGQNGHEGVVDVIIWHRAFVNAESRSGVTPLHLVAENCYNKLVKVLVEYMLCHWPRRFQMEVCNMLFKMKADANASDVHGQTLLNLASANYRLTLL